MTSAKFQLTRRAMLQQATAAAAVSLFEGCRRPLHIVAVPPPSFPVTPLTIDCHCHIFNGTDLQVSQFLSRAAFHATGLLEEILKVGAELLEELVDHVGPDGNEELAALDVWTGTATGTPSANHTLVADILGSPAALGSLEAEADARYKKTRSRVLNSAALKTIASRGDRPNRATTTQDERLRQMSAALANLTGPKPSLDDARLLIYQSFEFAENYQDVKTTHRDYQSQAAKLSPTAASTRAPLGSKPVSQPVELTDPTMVQRLPGYLRYLSEAFQYRTVQVHDYLGTFTPAADRDIDLMVAHLVDYDWPLNQGRATHTPLWTASGRATQIHVMERITLATYGKVHGFVPFDPFREVAFRAGKRPAHGGEVWSSLDLVKSSIGSLAGMDGPEVIGNGMIGVKLYPPMGFGATGNAGLGDPWSEQADKFPDWFGKDVTYPHPRAGEKAVASFGTRLDDVLEELFEWCESNDVPLLAHSSASNGITEAFKNLALAKNWKPVFTAHPNLRVCFGHLGSFDAAKSDNPAFATENGTPCSQSGIPCNSEDFIKLFADSNGQSRKLYGDSSFSMPILSDKEGLEQRYDNAYGDASSSGNKLLAARMMYGTDWNLIMTAGDLQRYLKGFVELAEGLPGGGSDLKGHSAADRFLGWNAVEYLGLRKTDKTRQRLEAFYRKNGLDFNGKPPVWMSKVDSAG